MSDSGIVRDFAEACCGDDIRINGCVCSSGSKCYIHGVLAPKALAALDALVAERDALLADSIGDRLGFDERLGAAEDNLVVQHQRFLDLDETLTAEIRSLNEQVVGAVDLLEGEVAERDRLREALEEIAGQAIDMSASGLDITDGEAVEIARAALA